MSADQEKLTAELVAALEDMVYMAVELEADGYIESAGGECDFMETEQFCGRYCEACGCIGAKVANARTAIEKAKVPA